jgi:hypothetical protein
VSFDQNDGGEATGMSLWQNDKRLLHYRRVSPAKDLPTITAKLREYRSRSD